MSRCVIPGLQRHSSHRMNIAMLRFESYALLDFLFKPLTSVPYFSTGLHDAMRQISSGLGHELGQLSSRPRAWKRWVTDGCTDSCPCLSNIIRVASWTGPIATTPCSLTNVQLPEIVGLISFVSTPKTYINMVGSTVLTSGHPSTKDLSGVRIPSVPRSDRSGNGRVGAPGCASDLFIFHPHVSLPPFQFSTLAHRLLKHRCKTLANKSHSFPPSQPSFFLQFY